MSEYAKFVESLSAKLVEALADDWDNIKDQYNTMIEEFANTIEDVDGAEKMPMEFYLLRALLVLKEYSTTASEEGEKAT
jgi:hypothetical protein